MANIGFQNLGDQYMMYMSQDCHKPGSSIPLKRYTIHIIKYYKHILCIQVVQTCSVGGGNRLVFMSKSGMHQVVYRNKCVPMNGKVASHNPPSFPKTNHWDITTNIPFSSFSEENNHICEKIFPKTSLATNPKSGIFFTISGGPLIILKQQTTPARFSFLEKNIAPRLRFISFRSSRCQKTHCTNIGELVHGVQTSRAWRFGII